MDIQTDENGQRFVRLEPNWKNTVRWFAQGLMMHDFEVGKGTVLASFMEQVRFLAANDPAELQRIIDEFKRKV